jgi:GNAT superfamily N-acetyltransferase
MIIRPATIDDLDELLAVLDRAFSWPRPPCLDFRRMYPHLFHPGRVGEHWIGVEQDRIVAVVGVYGLDLAVDGVMLHGAAIGQVATLPEFRGQGRMATMLEAAIAAMDRARVEFSWLIGERRRYAPHGWALGGSSVQFEIVPRDLPAPPDPGAVGRMRLQELVDTLVQQRERLRNSSHWPAHELASLVQGRGYGGVRIGGSWVIHGSRGDQVHFADGDVDELGLLFAHLVARTPPRRGQGPVLFVDCADEPTALSRACMRFHRSVQRRPSGMWRIGDLVALLGKAAEMAKPRVGPGSDALALVDTGTGQAATLVCEAGRVDVRAGVDARVVSASTRELSELCFGHAPIEHALPDLAPDSPLRQILPIRAHASAFFPV